MVPSKFSLGFLNTKYQINPNPKPGKVNNHDNVDLDKNDKNVWMLMDWKISGISAHALPIRILTPVRPRSDLWPRCGNVDTWSDRVGSNSLAITTSYAKKRRLGSCYVILSELEILTWLLTLSQCRTSLIIMLDGTVIRLVNQPLVANCSFTLLVSNCPGVKMSVYTLGVKLSVLHL